MKEVELNVRGMSFGSCAASVTRTLQGIPGVASVSVDLSGGIARVLTRSNVGLGAMIIALAAAGYDASLRRTADPEVLVGGQR